MLIQPNGAHAHLAVKTGAVWAGARAYKCGMPVGDLRTL